MPPPPTRRKQPKTVNEKTDESGKPPGRTRKGVRGEVEIVIGGASGEESQTDHEEANVSPSTSDTPHVNRSVRGTGIFGELEVPGQSHRKQGPIAVGKLGASAYRPFGSDIGSDSTCCKGGPGQIVCGNPVEDGQCGVQCDKCSNWFHASCQVVPSEAVRALDKFPILTWLCSECKPTLSKQSPFSEKMNQLENKVACLDESLREHMKLVHESLKEQGTAVAQQSQLIKQSVEEQTKLKMSYADTVKKTCAEAMAAVGSNAKSSVPQPAVNIGQQAAKEISGMLDGYMDKERRRCNIVIYNLPEDSGDSQAERNENDILKFREIMKQELHLNIRITRAFRAGKRLSDKPRLLIASLENVETKMELLKLAPQLRNSTEWSTLFINPDLTQKEREEGRKLRAELARRKTAGETSLYIKQGRIVRGPTQHQTSQSPENANQLPSSGTATPDTGAPHPTPTSSGSDRVPPNTQQTTAVLPHTSEDRTQATATLAEGQRKANAGHSEPTSVERQETASLPSQD